MMWGTVGGDYRVARVEQVIEMVGRGQAGMSSGLFSVDESLLAGSCV